MAEFLDKSGNIFVTDADTLTITVNCEGVMGAGIALDARLRWPAMFDAYRERSERGEMRPGTLMLWEPSDSQTRHRVLCFPTKNRWRAPSRLDYIRLGLDAVAHLHKEARISTIAMPHLGCSHGGLRWSDVRPLIVEALGPCEGLRVEMWDFNPRADDPWYDELERLLDGRSRDEIKELLGITSRQVTSLVEAMDNPRIRGLASLQAAPGVGEKTLGAVYALVFHREEDPPHQAQLPW